MSSSDRTMPYQETIQTVTEALVEVFDRLDRCFDLPDDLCQYKYNPAEWCINEILEHITLTSHYLMLVINKSRAKALKRARTQPIPDGESYLASIDIISQPDAFAWIRPEHMEPTRSKPMPEVRRTMRQQQTDCLAVLAQLSGGEGVLHRVSMSVQNLGRLDIYQWLYFLAQHARRHLVEIERIQSKWQQLTTHL